jgi:hypothetical protein
MMRELSKRILTKKSFAILLLFLLLGFTTACVAPEAQATLSPEDHEIAPLFRRFYLFYGGKDVFGLAISDARPEGDTTIQYTEAAKLVYDPNKPASQRFSLAPLGRSILVSEPPVEHPKDASLLFVDGHIIHPSLVELYNKLEEIVGPPMTEGRKNPNSHYIEQFFENMGIYYDPAIDKYGFLPYGLTMCTGPCRTLEWENAIPLGVYPIDPTFLSVVERLGVDFTGFAITPGYYADDKKWQQIFERVVLSAQVPNHPETLAVEPVMLKMPFITDPPKVDSRDKAMKFVPVKGELGYEVPLYFWTYLEDHGGQAVSGLPVSQLRQMGDHTYIQCFTNLCLEYEPQAVESRRVSLVMLGYPYKVMFGPLESDYGPPPALPTPVLPTPTPVVRTTTVQVWEAQPALDARLQQEIGVYVGLNGMPLSEVQPTLILTMPDRSQAVYEMFPTGMDGKSVFRLPLLQGANGTMITYAVCLQTLNGERFCVEDSFVIWSNP